MTESLLNFPVNCDRIAPWYRALETLAFGRALQRGRVTLLPWALTAGVRPRRVLLLGEGDGRFGAALLAAEPGLAVEVVDNSAGMLAAARGRYPAGADVRLHHAEARSWLRARGEEVRSGAAAPFDLIVTLFFLDCFPEAELAGLTEEIAGVATPRARWLVTDFRQPAGGGLRAWRARVWLGTMYALFRWTTGLQTRELADFRPHLFAQGFRRERAARAARGLAVAEGWRRGNGPTDQRRSSTGARIRTAPAAATTTA